MSGQYPFFRETGEEVQAVIGADAVSSDLNGTYQKPYAVLTQKRLYCKNEHGNFIVNTDQLLSAGMPSMRGPSSKLLWVAFGMVAYMIATQLIAYLTDIAYFHYFATEYLGIACFGIACLIAFLVIRVKHPLIAPALLCIYPICHILYPFCLRAYDYDSFLLYLLGYFSDAELIFWNIFPYPYIYIMAALDWICLRGPVILIVIYYIINRSMNNNNRVFQIVHTNGVFSFDAKAYPSTELKNFEAQANILQKGKVNGK